MNSFFKKTIGVLVAILVLVFSVSYLLKPVYPINNENRLCNVDDRFKIEDVNKKIIKKIDLKRNGLIVNMEIEDYIFKKLLKYNLLKYGNQELEAYGFNLKGDKLFIQVPKKIGPFKSQVDAYVGIGKDKNNLILYVEKVKIGKITLPQSIVESNLESIVSSKSDRVSIEKGKIYISLNRVDLDIENIWIKDDVLGMKLKITKDDIKKIGIGVIDNLFDF